MAQGKKRDPEATRTNILDAAENLFLAKGFGETPMSAIARKAGVTKSLIHHHFGSKENLWGLVKMRRFQEYAEQQSALLNSEETGLDVFLESIATYFKFLQSHPQVVRLKAWMSIEGDTSCGPDMDIGGALITQGADLIRESQNKGIIRADIDPVHMIIAALSLAGQWFQDKNHYCGHELFPPDASSEDLDNTYLDCMLKMLKEGVAPK